MIASSRRDLLKAILGSAAGRLLAQDSDADNVKIAHRINARAVSDDDLLFFQQIGLRWARLELAMRPSRSISFAPRSNVSPNSA